MSVEHLIQALYVPQPDEAADFAGFRKEAYTEELVNAGVPEQAAQAHTADWGNDQSIVNWQKAIGRWSNPEEHDFKALRISRRLMGYFVGDFYSRKTDCAGQKYVSTIQLQATGQGLGTALLQSFIDSDERSTWLHVLEGNEGARRLYNRLGFRDIRRESVKIADYPTAIILMRKD